MHGPEAPQLVKAFTVRGNDFASAGTVSIAVKKMLKDVGLNHQLLRRAAIATFEAEMNTVMYGGGGEVRLLMSPTTLRMEIQDQGPGIPDLDLAMTEGWSTATPEMREMGFGAGMGLPNIKRNCDRLNIKTEVGQGTTVELELDIT